MRRARRASKCAGEGPAGRRPSGRGESDGAARKEAPESASGDQEHSARRTKGLLALLRNRARAGTTGKDLQTMHLALEHDACTEDHRDLSSAVGHAVRAPLAALRASMETLARSFEAGDRRHLAARGALDEIVRLGHELQTLLDYALPLPVQPISCSLREIVCSAVEGLVPRRRADVLTAIEDRRARLEVDGPLLSRSLSRLLETDHETSAAPALLHARLECSDAVFTVVLEPAAPKSPVGTDLRGTTAASVLGLLLARRDVERMGGAFHFRRGADDRIVSEIRLPAACARREAA